MENLNGRKIVEDGDLCERRNGNAVDFSVLKISVIACSVETEMHKFVNLWQGEELI